MNEIKLKRAALTLCGLFSLMGVAIGTTEEAHAIAGAQSSATLTMSAAFTDPLVSVNLMTTEAVSSSLSPTNYVINNTQSSLWEDMQVNTSITDSAYNASVAAADATGAAVSQFATAVADRRGQYTANALALHDVNFVAVGTGLLTVTAAYDLLMQVYKDTPGESASGYFLAGLYLRNLTQNTESFTELTLAHATGVAPEDFFYQAVGDISTSLDFALNDAGAFRVIVDGNADANSVPEPSTFALLGFGLAGAALLRRRYRR